VLPLGLRRPPGGPGLSREEGEGTAEFLLAQPVSRLSVALQKLGAAFILILSFVAVFMAVSAAYLSILGGGTVSAAHILIIGSGYALSFLVFVALGFLASVFVTRPRSVLPLAMALSFGTYLLGAASRIVPSWEWLEALSPMDWFSTNRSLAEGGLRGGYLAAAIGIIVALPAAAVGLYARKDIKA
jgi:ABC-2 type transport system permease protein